MKYQQLNLFDTIDQYDLNSKISNLLKCKDKSVLNPLSASIIEFQRLPVTKQFILNFSGGKDSHVLLAVYLLYLELGNQPLDVVVRFADTKLEHHSLYKTIDLVREFCNKKEIPFEEVKGKDSFWWTQFALGYPVPDHFIRWCTGKLKVQPLLADKQKRIALTGRHFGESKARDIRLNKSRSSCGSDTCGQDLIKDTYDPLIHWRNCQIWDAIFYLDGLFLYENCFTHLKQQYAISEDTKTGSLRMGCFMCPVIALSSIKTNFKSGLIDEEAVKIREFLEELRTARRIANPRTKKNGAIYIVDRRKYWGLLNKEYLLKMKYITSEDVNNITNALFSDYAYPQTYPRDWIDLEHEKILIK